jgi:hypothetical protein
LIISDEMLFLSLNNRGLLYAELSTQEPRWFALDDKIHKVFLAHRGKIFARRRAGTPLVLSIADMQPLRTVLSLRGEAELRPIFPNPALEFLHVELPSSVLGEIRARVFDTRGVLVKSLNIQDVQLFGNARLCRIPVADIPSGAYQLDVRAASSAFVRRYRWIKQ